MRDRHAVSIERLRKVRERAAAASLSALKTAGQNAENAVTSFEEELRSQNALQLRAEISLYEKARADIMTDRQMSEMSRRIQDGREQTGRMSKHLTHLKDEATKASESVESARLKHAASLRSSKKWEKLAEHIRKQAAREEPGCDDGLSYGAYSSSSEMDGGQC